MEITRLSARVFQNDGAQRTYRIRTLAFGRKCMLKFDKWGRWLQCYKPLKYEYFPSGHLVPFTHRYIRMYTYTCISRIGYTSYAYSYFMFVYGLQPVWFLANNQLDALFHVFIYFISLYVSRITVLIIRRSNCINTSSGIISLCKWLLGIPVSRVPSWPEY